MSKRANGEGSIYQRKSDGKWVGSIVQPDGKRKVFYGKKRSEVYQKVNAALNQLQQGTFVNAKTQPLKEYLENWLEEVHKPTIRLSSYVKYRKLLNNHILPGLGHIPLQKLTPQQVQVFYSSKLKKGLSPKMINSIHGVLHKALDNAVKWNLVTRNVCDAVSPPRIPKKEKQILTKEQAQALLVHVKEHRLEALLTLVITTGMRRGEILALRWADINFAERSVQVKRTVDYIPKHGFVETEPKTNKGRRKIMLAVFVVEVLINHQLQQEEQRAKVGAAWIDKDLVFTNTWGDYFSPNTLLKVFGRVLAEAGLPHIRFHDLRHSAATLLLGMRVHPKIVQEILGHSQITMTLDTYSHALPSMQDEVTGRWDDEFGS